MHDGEVDIDVHLVRRLVAQQFPQWADLPIVAIQSTGTVNAIYRIGDRLCARLPRVPAWAEGLEREWTWLPKLVPHLSLQIPQPVGMGQPTPAYPLPWVIYAWIDGQPYADDRVDDEQQAAADLAQFVRELRRINPGGAPRAGRQPLRQLDAMTRAAIEAGRGVIDRVAATRAWVRALEAPIWAGRSVWIHADLLRPNLLVHEGRLSAVLDFGGAGVGDPAADVIAAWSVFGHAGRAVFRDTLGVEYGTWEVARGFALHQAALITPYYGDTNPEFVALAQRTVAQVLADSG